MGGWSVEIDPAHSHGPRLASFLDHGRPAASLGLSHRSSASNSGRLAATLAWLSAHAGTIVVVEGSYLARWNRMALEGASEGEASSGAASEASAVRRRIERVLAESDSVSAGFLDWADLLGAPEVCETIRALGESGEADSGFRSALRREVDEYVARTRGTSDGSLSRETRGFLRSYVIEETAVLLDLQRRGYIVEAYHGPDLPLVRSVAAGRFPSLLPYSFPQRTHVSIRLTREVAKDPPSPEK